MLISLLFSDPLAFLVVALAFIAAFTLHEFAHAFTANALGDPTPRSLGRLTLNPLAHLDPLGTILLFIAGFGWGKPVPFNPHYLKNPRLGTTLIAFAGPAMNIFLAFLGAILVFLLGKSNWSDVAFLFMHLNLILAAFNLIPIGPLDGSHILSGLLPRDLAYEYETIVRQYGFILLILFILPLVGGVAPVNFILTPLINFLETGVLLLAQTLVGFVVR